MLNRETAVERRKYKRYRADRGSLLMLKPNTCGVGQIIEISTGGLTFEYLIEHLSGKSPSMQEQETELRIFVPRSSFRLNGIPCQGVWDLGLYEVPGTPLLKRRCRVKFGKLTPQQVSQIEHFIKNYTISSPPNKAKETSDATNVCRDAAACRQRPPQKM